jgi:hypothetical protein
MAYVAVLLDKVDSSDTDVAERSSFIRGVTSRTFDDNSNGEPSVETGSFALHQRGSAAASAHVESQGGGSVSLISGWSLDGSHVTKISRSLKSSMADRAP